MEIMETKIAIAYENSSSIAGAATLADELQLPLVSIEANDYPLLLVPAREKLEIRETGTRNARPLFVDFLKGKIGFRAMRANRQNEMLAKAVGIKSNRRIALLDATAGLGHDAWILAQLGCRVTMLERSKLIAALLKDALNRAKSAQEAKDFRGNIRLQVTDARDYLSTLKMVDVPDVVYLDPMFPCQNKSALAKKEMRLLRQIVGEDDDANELLVAALRCIPKRVVVKRPRSALTLKGRKPDLIFQGQSNRFDVYFPQLPKQMHN